MVEAPSILALIYFKRGNPYDFFDLRHLGSMDGHLELLKKYGIFHIDISLRLCLANWEEETLDDNVDDTLPMNLLIFEPCLIHNKPNHIINVDDHFLDDNTTL